MNTDLVVFNQARTEYDPKAIARYYSRRPWQVIWRGLRITTGFVTFVLSLYWDSWTNQEEKNKQKRATALRKLLTNLGPTFIKIGQALSTRPDLVRKDFLEELIKLQDQLPPFDNQTAFNIIETDLQASLKQVYQEISPNPIAAASLGQVYRAKLYTGEEVAVKVQRPNLRPVISLDLHLLRLIVNWLKPLLPVNIGHDLNLIVDEFGVKLFEEIDYQNEGRNAEKFATNFRNDSDIKVPKIYWKYSSHRILTLEWIDGFKLTDTAKIADAGLDLNELITIGVTSGLRQLLEHGFFHADPHPGNLFATPDGRMAYIDFGMMDQLEENTKETIASAVVQLINKDYQALADDFVRLGFLTADTDLTPIIPALEEVLGSAVGESVKDFNFKTVTDHFSELMYEYPFRIPSKFALIIRSIITQEGLALTLNPDFKIVEVSYPYVSKRLLTGESPELRRRLIDILFKDGKFQWQRLENMLAIAQSDQQFDLIPTARLGLTFLLSEEGKYFRQQLLIALTEDDRLHTEEVQRIWSIVKDELKPQRLFDVALTALREISTERLAAVISASD